MWKVHITQRWEIDFLEAFKKPQREDFAKFEVEWMLIRTHHSKSLHVSKAQAHAYSHDDQYQ